MLQRFSTTWRGFFWVKCSSSHQTAGRVSLQEQSEWEGFAKAADSWTNTQGERHPPMFRDTPATDKAQRTASATAVLVVDVAVGKKWMMFGRCLDRDTCVAMLHARRTNTKQGMLSFACPICCTKVELWFLAAVAAAAAAWHGPSSDLFLPELCQFWFDTVFVCWQHVRGSHTNVSHSWLQPTGPAEPN